MVNARWCNYTDVWCNTCFPKCPKGVTQRLKLIPVKTHEAHTFYEYESHTCSARPHLSLTSPVIVKVAKAPMRLQEPFAALSSLYVFTIRRVKDPTLVCKSPVTTFESRASTSSLVAGTTLRVFDLPPPRSRSWSLPGHSAVSTTSGGSAAVAGMRWQECGGGCARRNIAGGGLSCRWVLGGCASRGHRWRRRTWHR